MNDVPFSYYCFVCSEKVTGKHSCEELIEHIIPQEIKKKSIFPDSFKYITLIAGGALNAVIAPHLHLSVIELIIEIICAGILLSRILR